jgi:hypothetical protein
MKKLLMIGAISSLLLTGCKKDGDESSSTSETTTTTVEDEVIVQTTVEDDQENLQASLSEIVSCMGAMKDGDLMTSFVDFVGISNGEILDEEFVETLLDELGEALDTIEEPEEPRLPFETLTGTWTYDISNETWNRTKTPSNKIIVEFPSDKNQTQNNIEASLSDYVDAQYTFDMEDVWLPKSFELSVKKNGIELAKMDLNNLSLEESNDALIPTDLDGSLFLAPFTFSMSGERTTTTEFTAEMTLNDGTGCGYGVEATLKLKNDDYENLKDEDFISIEGYMEHNNMKMEYFVALGELAELNMSDDDLKMEDVNSNIDVKVFINDQNIGELSLAESANDEEEVEFMITYKDGTTEDADRFYEPFFDDLEAEFASILGDWDELLEEDDDIYIDDDYNDDYDDGYDDDGYDDGGWEWTEDDQGNEGDWIIGDDEGWEWTEEYPLDDGDWSDDYGDGAWPGADGEELTDEQKELLDGLIDNSVEDGAYDD